MLLGSPSPLALSLGSDRPTRLLPPRCLSLEVSSMPGIESNQWEHSFICPRRLDIPNAGRPMRNRSIEWRAAGVARRK